MTDKPAARETWQMPQLESLDAALNDVAAGGGPGADGGDVSTNPS